LFIRDIVIGILINKQYSKNIICSFPGSERKIKFLEPLYQIDEDTDESLMREDIERDKVLKNIYKSLKRY